VPDRTVLCFGDSNTWGYEPGTGARYGREVRWSGALSRLLGASWHVVEAGLNGRTTVFEDPLADRCGRRHLGPVLASAAPVDVVVLLLGTNDLKTRLGGVSAYDIAEGAGLLVDLGRASGAGPEGRAPDVLLVAPPPLGSLSGWEGRDDGAFAGFATGWRGALDTSRAFAEQYARVARVRGVRFLDAGAHVTSSDVDGIHWGPAGHAALAQAVAADLEAS
jgi:lysophospholipase L1-like esterase